MSEESESELESLLGELYFLFRFLCLCSDFVAPVTCLVHSDELKSRFPFLDLTLGWLFLDLSFLSPLILLLLLLLDLLRFLLRWELEGSLLSLSMWAECFSWESLPGVELRDLMFLCSSEHCLLSSLLLASFLTSFQSAIITCYL